MEMCDLLVRLKQRFGEISKLFKPSVLLQKEKISRIYKNIYLASGSWIFNKDTDVNICMKKFQKILNLAPCEVEIDSLLTCDVYSIDLLDVCNENLIKYFETLNDFFYLERKRKYISDLHSRYISFINYSFSVFVETEIYLEQRNQFFVD